MEFNTVIVPFLTQVYMYIIGTSIIIFGYNVFSNHM